MPLARFIPHPRRMSSLLCVVALVLLALCIYKSAPGALLHAVPWRASTTGSRLPATATIPASASKDLSDLSAPFSSWPLARVCNETVWTPGIVFLCDNNSGGIGNIRNAILTCLRYAIAAGATGLVLPQIRTRSAKDLTSIWQDHKPFDHFFDEAHFRSSLASACPGLVVYSDVHEIPGVRHPDKFEPVTPKEFAGLRGGCHFGFPNYVAQDFGPRFRQWVADKEVEFRFPPLSQTDRRVFRLTWGSQFEWPVWTDGPEVVATFGSLLRFRRDILDLGKKVAAAMREYVGSVSRKGAKRATKYVGMHLRSEHDALPAWPTAEDQTAAYLREAGKAGFEVAYLATGNVTEADTFKARALRDGGLHVVTKEDLLQAQPQKHDFLAFQDLTWDQRALIDFVVLTESDYFLGMNPSSFSMNVALKRHLKEDGVYTRPWKVGREDGRSWLVGNYDNYWESWLWFYETMWP